MTTDAPITATHLSEVARELAATAAESSSGRAARSLPTGGRTLRQTMVALAAGAELAEHESPGEAVLQVLDGRVTLHADGLSWLLAVGEQVPIPPARHGLRAHEDSVVLLTVVVGTRP